MINKKRGFTLIELLVVMAIIGLLLSIVLISLNSMRAKARDAKRVIEVRNIITALDVYYAEMGHYPEYTNLGTRCNTNSPTSSLSALVDKKIMSSIPIDPTNKQSPLPRLCYEYTSASSGSSSYYCDGKPRNHYLYAFLFSTESITLNFPLLTDSCSPYPCTGEPNGQYTYCIHGPLK